MAIDFDFRGVTVVGGQAGLGERGAIEVQRIAQTIDVELVGRAFERQGDVLGEHALEHLDIAGVDGAEIARLELFDQLDCF
ncbi:hypothetical protein D3C87_1573370 [compost metagenome]